MSSRAKCGALSVWRNEITTSSSQIEDLLAMTSRFHGNDRITSFNQKMAIRKTYLAAVVGVDTGLFGQFLPVLT